MKSKNKIIILDRDGVINHDSDDYIKSPEEWLPIDGSLEAIGDLTKAGYSVFVLTNQSGIARRYFSLDALNKMHQKMISLTAKHGGIINDIFFCPHGPNDDCACRKPLSGMYQQLQSQHQIPHFKEVPSLGDSVRDLQAARSAGAKPILLRTGKGNKSESLLSKEGFDEVEVFDDLADFTKQLLNEHI